jgi:hypothetical protein
MYNKPSLSHHYDKSKQRYSLYLHLATQKVENKRTKTMPPLRQHPKPLDSLGATIERIRSRYPNTIERAPGLTDSHGHMWYCHGCSSNSSSNGKGHRSYNSHQAKWNHLLSCHRYDGVLDCLWVAEEEEEDKLRGLMGFYNLHQCILIALWWTSMVSVVRTDTSKQANTRYQTIFMHYDI